MEHNQYKIETKWEQSSAGAKKGLKIGTKSENFTYITGTAITLSIIMPQNWVNTQKIAKDLGYPLVVDTNL